MASVSKVIHTDNQLHAGQFGKTAYTAWIRPKRSRWWKSSGLGSRPGWPPSRRRAPSRRRSAMGTRAYARVRIAFHLRNSVGTRNMNLYEAQWLACVPPYRRFAAALTDGNARLGADVDRYSVITSDLHRLLVAGLPAHREKLWTLPLASLPSTRRDDGIMTRDWKDPKNEFCNLPWLQPPKACNVKRSLPQNRLPLKGFSLFRARRIIRKHHTPTSSRSP